MGLVVRHSFERSARVRTAFRLEVLTERERERLGLATTGLSNDEIVRALTVTTHIVKTHIGALLASCMPAAAPTSLSRRTWASSLRRAAV